MHVRVGIQVCDAARRRRVVRCSRAVTLTDLLAQIRSLYVKELASAVRSAKSTRSTMHVEPLLRDKKGKVVREGTIATGVRLDLVVERKGELEDVRVDSKSRLEFEPIPIPWSDDLAVTIEPFVWDALVVEVDVPTKRAIGVARPWVDEWMDTKDAQKPGKDGLARAVHFAGDPQPGPAKGGKGSMLALDLGSAPPDALLALVESFARAGATTLRIASSSSVEATPARARAAKKAASKTEKKIVKKSAVKMPSKPAKKAKSAKKTPPPRAQRRVRASAFRR